MRTGRKSDVSVGDCVFAGVAGINDPEPHQQDAQQAGGGAEGEEIAVAEGGQPAAKEGDDDIDGADDGVGGADVGGRRCSGRRRTRARS